MDSKGLGNSQSFLIRASRFSATCISFRHLLHDLHVCPSGYRLHADRTRSSTTQSQHMTAHYFISHFFMGGLVTIHSVIGQQHHFRKLATSSPIANPMDRVVKGSSSFARLAWSGDLACVAVSFISGSRMANSSPPMRATISRHEKTFATVAPPCGAFISGRVSVTVIHRFQIIHICHNDADGTDG